MVQFIVSVMGLFDKTLSALVGVPVFLFFLSAFLVLVVLGLYHLLSRSASGRRLN